MINYTFQKANSIGEGVENLYQILTYLRSPEGCPWDRKQDNKSITACMIDEVYEYLDGVQKNSVESCREEIGDVMINVFMTQLIHSEKKEFTPVEALNEVCEKLIRRHPHVFGDVETHKPEDAQIVWNNVKSNVEGHKLDNNNIFKHIADSLPPMEEAYEIQKKIAKVGLDYTDPKEVLTKVKEELKELEDAISNDDKDNQEEELGDLLFSVINLGRVMNIRPNIAMRRCNTKIKCRFQSLFDIAMKRNIPLDKDNYSKLYLIWDEIKSREKGLDV